MKKSLFLSLFFYILLIGLVFNILGCGGSNLNNPVSDSDTMDDGDMVDVGELDVTVNVTKKTVKPGETVDIAATVEGVKGTSVTLNWLNITDYGTLSSDNDLSVTWTAPDSLDGDQAKVEVLLLVVTVISEVVSVEDNEIKADTQIISDTTKILLQVVSD